MSGNRHADPNRKGLIGRQSEFRETILNLLKAAPQLRPILDEHLADHDGTMLAYSLLPDFIRELNREWVMGGVPATCLQTFALAIEKELSKKDSDTTDLVALGLFEEMENSAVGPELERHLGTLGKGQLREMRNWRSAYRVDNASKRPPLG